MKIDMVQAQFTIMIKSGVLFFLFLASTLYGTAQPEGDSMLIAASQKYKNPSFFKRLFLGANYRKAWAMPVKLPVFHLKDRGFTIKEAGGGQQTISLRLVDNSGKEWALRTIDKNVEKALPPWLQNTLAEKVVQDMVSAAQPFAPLTIPALTQATDVIAASPVFYYVPDDPDFGEYRALFKNTMCMLEEREPTPDHSDTKNTEDLVTALLKSGKAQLNQEAVLRARLLDMLVGDWDRHQDQWRWGFEKVDGFDNYYAIPRDRDQAYFFSKGLLVKLARAVAAKHLVGFAKDTRRLRKLNAKEWNFDRMFLAGLDKKAWQQAIQNFTSALPDSVLHKAIQKMPPEIYALYGAEIETILISRRNSLQKDALNYYRFLATAVVVTGSDDADKFVISAAKDSITIMQFTGKDFSREVYNRSFHRSETNEIMLIGLGGADVFLQEGSAKSRIKLFVDGGTGKNEYRLEKSSKVKFSDSGTDAQAYLKQVKEELKIKD